MAPHGHDLQRKCLHQPQRQFNQKHTKPETTNLRELVSWDFPIYQALYSPIPEPHHIPRLKPNTHLRTTALPPGGMLTLNARACSEEQPRTMAVQKRSRTQRQKQKPPPQQKPSLIPIHHKSRSISKELPQHLTRDIAHLTITTTTKHFIKRLLHRSPHQIHPTVPFSHTDRERHMPHPQPRMTTRFRVPRRPAEPLHQKITKPRLRRPKVRLTLLFSSTPIHRAKHRIFSHPRIKPRSHRRKTGLPDQPIQRPRSTTPTMTTTTRDIVRFRFFHATS